MRFLILPLLLSGNLCDAGEPSKPSIIVIYADDIGYGDLGCYGATKVKTPNCDRLANEGLRFTDAHSPASVCTPSRYSLLTGEYAFRKKGTGIASGEEGLLIEPGRSTLPSILKSAGYTTAVIGKWHLGLGARPTDYNAEIKPGPLEIGFDYAWIMPATGDRVPCVWVENHRVVNLDPADPIRLDYSIQRGQPKSMLMGIPRIGGQTGGKSALWNDQELSTVIAAKSRDFIRQNREKPFFLFMTTHNIHVPRAPNPRFIGKSDCGLRGDAIVEFDWTVGQVMEELDELGIASNTLLLASSDNGGILDNNGPDKVHGIGDPDGTNGHKPNGPLRGTKSTVFEGGTRVPMIVRWPDRIKPGTTDALISHTDFPATLAALTGVEIARGQARDSGNHLAALTGNSPNARTFFVSQGNNANPLGFREGRWKYLPHGGGTDSPKGPALYDLSADLGERVNLAEKHPEIVARMSARLREITGIPVQQAGGNPGKRRKPKADE